MVFGLGSARSRLDHSMSHWSDLIHMCGNWTPFPAALYCCYCCPFIFLFFIKSWLIL